MKYFKYSALCIYLLISTSVLAASDPSFNAYPMEYMDESNNLCSFSLRSVPAFHRQVKDESPRVLEVLEHFCDPATFNREPYTGVTPRNDIRFESHHESSRKIYGLGFDEDKSTLRLYYGVGEGGERYFIKSGDKHGQEDDIIYANKTWIAYVNLIHRGKLSWLVEEPEEQILPPPAKRSKGSGKPSRR